MTPTRSFRALKLAGCVAAAAMALTTPAHAQTDISGDWGSRLHEDLGHRFDGPELGDYTGLPLNDAARQKAQSWDAAILSMPEEQTKPHPAQYSMRGPGTNISIGKINDPYSSALLAYTIKGLYGRADRTIWLDGRPHPSEHAEHTWQGFSTGVVEQNKLVVTTTHMKAGFINRNGAPASTKSTLTEYFVRHGDMLTVTSIVDDPVYLDEPFIRTMTWVLTPGVGLDTRMRSEVVEEVEMADDAVPAYPLGTRHEDFAKTFGLPFEATQGGSVTLYPEYAARIEALRAGRAAPPLPPVATPAAPRRTAPKSDEVETLQLRPGLHLLVVDGVNIVVRSGQDGVFIVNGGPAASAAKTVAAIRRLSDGPIRYLVNTGPTEESLGANATIVAAGGPRTSARSGGALPGPVDAGVQVVAHENVGLRLSAVTPTPSTEAVPSTAFRTTKDLHFNGEPIELRARPSAVSDGDITVFFRGSDVVAAGALFDTVGYPRIDPEKGGTIDGVISGLTAIIKTTIPERNQIGGTLVIPARGRISNESDVVEYRDMLVIVRDRVRDLVAKGRTLAQVKAARPLLEYDGIYGQDPAWTGEMFLEAIYRQLKSGKPA